MNQPLDLAVVDPRLQGLRRPGDTGVTSGLCRALAERFGIDPLVVRIAAIVLTFAAGLGLVLYAWGTLLTPRVGGTAPIQSFVPAFARWPRTTQLVVIAVSSVAVVIAFSSTTGLSIGPAVLLVVLFLVARRKGRPPTQRWAPPTWSPYPASTNTAEAPPDTVEAWRARVGAHARRPPTASDPLPVVDLYGPEPAARTTTPPTVPPAETKPPVTFLGGVAVVLVGVGAAALPVVLGLQPTLLWSFAAATGAVGLSFLLWALLVRSRRLPSALLVVALLGGAGTTAASFDHLAPSSRGFTGYTAVTGELVTFPFTATSNAVLDLRDTPLDVAAVVQIDATLSDVRVLLPGAPRHVQTTGRLSDIIDDPRPTGAEPAPASQLTLVVNATLSDVTLEYPS